MKQYLFFAPLFIFVFGAVGMQFYSGFEAPTTNEKVVDLSNRNLTTIPDNFKEQILKSEVLILDGNQLINLPEWLKEAKYLTKISVDNNPQFDFFKFTVDFQEMTQMEEISASDCQIHLIPYQLTFFSRLKILDLSGNQITQVPYHFSFLSSLQECDLSGNEIGEVGYSFRDLFKLKKLDLSGNENLNAKDLCASLAGKKMEELHLYIKDTLPESLSHIELNSLDIVANSKTIWGSSLATVNAKNIAINNEVAESKLPKDLIISLAANPFVRDLTFEDFRITSIPSALAGKSTIKNLDIASSQLEDISELGKMNSLTSLNIKENPLTLSQIEELKMKLPGCNIQSDEASLKGENISYLVTPPVKEFIVPIEKMTVNPKIKSQFVSSSNETVLDIPENAFVDEKGKVITTPVEIQFREFNDPFSIAMSGIPMQIKNEDGTTGNFSSAGMFELNAFSDGKAVYPNPKSLITASIISKQDTPYDLYSFENNKGWEKVQAQPIVPQILENNGEVMEATGTTGQYNSGYNSLLGFDTTLMRRKYVAFPKILFSLKKKASEKSFLINFSTHEMYTAPKDVRSRFAVNMPDEFATVLSKGLLYNGNNFKEDFKLMDTIRKSMKSIYSEKGHYKHYKVKGKRYTKYKYSENVLLKDINLTPDTKTDDYILSFNYRGEKYKIHVIPAGETGNAAKVQTLNKKFYQNYLFAKSKYDAEIAQAMDEYKTEVQKAQDSLDKILKKNGNMSFNEAKQVMETAGKAMYQLQVMKFGITNCDVVGRMIKPKAVRLTFKDVLGKALIFFQMIRIDKKINAITYVSPQESLILDYGHDETALMFVMGNDQIGIISADELKKHRDDSSIEVKVIETKASDPQKVRAML